jgi:hypothetical protein
VPWADVCLALAMRLHRWFGLAWPKHDWGAQLSPDITGDMQEKAAFLINEKMIQRVVSIADIVELLLYKRTGCSRGHEDADISRSSE